jgi:hypothetical protein
MHRNADAVLQILGEGRRREIYRGQDGNWYITYGGGQISQEIVRSLVEAGRVRRVYAGCDEGFWLGDTIDLDATQEHRRKTGERRTLIYVDGEIGRIPVDPPRPLSSGYKTYHQDYYHRVTKPKRAAAKCK